MADGPTDDELMDAMRAGSGVPPDLVDRAKQLLTWRNVDAELAELLTDSFEAAASAGVRSVSETARSLTFTSRAGSLEIDHLRDEALLVGRTDLSGSVVVELETLGGIAESVTVVDGEFELTSRSGPCRIRVTRDGEAVVTTEWMNLS